MSSSDSPLTLSQLIALNDEIAAMTRAGIPLDRGLIDWGGDLPGRIGHISKQLGERIERGETLEQIVANDRDLFPPLYRAVVMAGIRSGRLSVALEGISQSSRRVMELRRTVRLALIYPLFVAAIAYAFFVYLIDNWLPPIVDAQYEMEYSTGPWIQFLQNLHDNPWWKPVVPLVVIIAIVLFLLRTSRSSAIDSTSWFDFGRLQRAGSVATFSEVLTLLVGQNVPLEEALALAGEASGNRRLRAATSNVSERLKRGETGNQAFGEATAIPPMFAMVVINGTESTATGYVASSYGKQLSTTSTPNGGLGRDLLTDLVNGRNWRRSNVLLRTCNIGTLVSHTLANGVEPLRGGVQVSVFRFQERRGRR